MKSFARITIAFAMLFAPAFQASAPKTHSKRLDRLKAQGASDSQLARIHAPIGLNIGAVSPSEIAVAIMAEITARLRLPAGAPLKTKSAA